MGLDRLLKTQIVQYSTNTWPNSSNYHFFLLDYLKICFDCCLMLLIEFSLMFETRFNVKRLDGKVFSVIFK